MKNIKGFQFIMIFLIGLALLNNFTFVGDSQEETTAPDQLFSSPHIPTEKIMLTDSDIMILYPRSTLPVIVEKNESFTIQFETTSFENLHAILSTAYDPIPDTIELIVEDTWNQNGIWYATVSIPETTPEELYNLSLVVETGDSVFSATRPRAVSVKEEISDSFSFIHISDFHIGDPRGFKENIKETLGWKAAKKCIDEVNLLQPDFVVITGDLVFGQLYPFEYTREYKKCYQILQLFQVPTYLCPGNHDGYIQTGQDGFEFWEKYFGPLFYSFDYGNAHFISVNSYDWPKQGRIGFSYLVFNWGGYIQEEQLQWIAEDLSSTDADLKIMMMHHNPLWDTKNDSLLQNGYEGREEILSLIDEYEVDSVLAGHVHYDDVTSKDDTIFITTTTAASGLERDGYWGYRLITVENGTITTYNYKEPKYSIPSYRLNRTYEGTHQAIIENDLEMDITAHLQFLLPAGEYTVENGEIIMKREVGDLVELYITSNVEGNSEITVTVS